MNTTTGCDSIITTSLTAVSAYNTTESIEACENTVVIYPDGASETVTSNTSHTSLLTSTSGCDSTVVTSVIVHSVSNSSASDLVCEGTSYTFPDGSTQVITNAITQTSTLQTIHGCDSVITTTVNVTPLPDVTTSVSNNVITANQQGASYQWIDCNNGNTPIAGETNISFTPTVNGQYAVQITLNGCTSTSSCTIISTIGIEEIDGYWASIYPNPTSEFLTVETNANELKEYQIIDMQGRLVMKGSLDTSKNINVKNLAPGSYSIELSGQSTYRIRFVKE